MTELLNRNERFEIGLKTRTEVLGADYVGKALETVDAFTAPLQQMITEHAWGDIWSRPGLPRKTRSIVNLAMLTALNRPAELAVHVRGALNNGVSEEEIMETFLHSAIYCGIPAAMDSFKVAAQVIGEVRASEAGV